MSADASEPVSPQESGGKHPSFDKPLTLIVVKRLGIFFLALCLLCLLFWYAGSFQTFLDSTQAMLVRLLKYAALALIGTSGLGVGLSAAFALFRRYPARLRGIVAYLLLLAFASGALILADALLLLYAGMGG